MDKWTLAGYLNLTVALGLMGEEKEPVDIRSYMILDIMFFPIHSLSLLITSEMIWKPRNCVHLPGKGD